MEHIDDPLWSEAFGSYLTDRGDHERAKRCLLHLLERDRKTSDALALNRILRPLVALYERWGRPEDAARYRAMLAGPGAAPPPVE
jgi:hypothetical protein